MEVFNMSEKEIADIEKMAKADGQQDFDVNFSDCD